MPPVIPAATGARQVGDARRRIDPAILYAGFLLQMFGLEGVDPAVSAFLTSLYVGFVALFTSILDKKPLGMVAVVGVLMVTIGAAFISGPPQLSFDTPEWLTVLCAVLFAAHIVATDKVTRRSPPPRWPGSACLGGCRSATFCQPSVDRMESGASHDPPVDPTF